MKISSIVRYQSSSPVQIPATAVCSGTQFQRLLGQQARLQTPAPKVTARAQTAAAPVRAGTTTDPAAAPAAGHPRTGTSAATVAVAAGAPAALAARMAVEPQATSQRSSAKIPLGAETSTDLVQPAPVTPTTGLMTLVDAIMNGAFQPAYVTDPSKLMEVTPMGSYQMASTSYATDDSAQKLAQLLGGTVVQKPAFPLPRGWQAPLANFIQLPSGQVVNAGELQAYARFPYLGRQQLLFDLTQEINQGGAVSQFYDAEQACMSSQTATTLSPPEFQVGDSGPAIAGMTYPAGSLAADGKVINPSAQWV